MYREAMRSLPGEGRVMPTLQMNPSLPAPIAFSWPSPRSCTIKNAPRTKAGYAIPAVKLSSFKTEYLLPSGRRKHPKDMSNNGSDRISVLRGKEVVPLIPTCAHGMAKEQPWHGVLLEHHSVPAMEIPEHQHQELCLHLQTEGAGVMEWWSGGRNGIEQSSPGTILLVPPGTRDRVRWEGASDRLLINLSPEWMNQIAEEAGAPVPEFLPGWSIQDPGARSSAHRYGTADCRRLALGASLRRPHDSRCPEPASAALCRASDSPYGSPGGESPRPFCARAMEYMDRPS